VPRTARVAALTDLETYVLERAAFVNAVTGDRLSAHAADAVISDRLGAT